MAKISKYSIEAIQDRQVQQYVSWVKSKPVDTNVETSKPQKPQASNQPRQQNTAVILPPPKNDMGIPSAPGFLVQDQAKIKTIIGTEGVEPVYYSSKVRDGWAGTWDAVVANPFKNWARRVYANINNPRDILPAPTPEQTQRVEVLRKKYENATEASWDYKANKFVTENVFGLDMNDMFQTAALKEVAQEAAIKSEETAASDMKKAEFAQNVHEAVGSVKEAGKAVAFGVLGAAGWVIKNGVAVLKTVDETADEIAGEDFELPQVAMTGAEKFQRATLEGDFDWLGEVSSERLRVAAKENKWGDIAAFAQVANSINPIEIFKDVGRLVLNLDKLPPGKFLASMNRELAGSSALYSRIFDDSLNEEYKRRYAAGESPQKLVLELQNPVVELIGDIALDPTTWFTGKKAAAALIDPKTGARIIEGGLKSASRNAIDSKILDSRMVKEVKNAVDVIVSTAESTTPKSRDQALEVVRAAVKATQEAVIEHKNARGITSLTSTGKQQQYIEQSKNFMQELAARVADHPDGLDLFTGTIKAMIDLAKDTDVDKAFVALANSPLGQMPLSPRGMRVGNMLAGLDEAGEAIQKFIDAKDIKGLANLYADKMEAVVKRTVLSVEEMRGAADDVKKLTADLAEAAGDAKKIKSITSKLDEAKRIAQEYKDLPQHVKFFNGANEVVKKPWMKSMSFFSEVYFGLNRFAYPARNVVSTMPALAYEFGWGNAAEIALKSITGAQIETAGRNALTRMSDEIASIVGYVPEAFNRGNTPISEFVTKDKKYFGLIRKGGDVATLSEQLMGAQIMLKTVQREMKNALKSGVIPDTSALQAAGLHADDAKKLYQYALEHGGSADKIVADFRKFMDGAEDTFRHLPMNERLDGFMENVFMKADYDTLLKTAKSSDEFIEGVKKIWDRIEGQGEWSRLDEVNLSDDIPPEFTDDIQRFTMLKMGSPIQVDNFKRVLQGWRNAEAQMGETAKSMVEWFRKSGVDVGKYTPEIMELGQRQYARQDVVRELIRKLSDAEDVTTADMWDELNKLPDFKISQFSDIDPAKVTTKELKRVMWQAYFDWSGRARKNHAGLYVEGMRDILEKMAGELGTDIPAAARMADVPYQRTVDAWEYANKLYDETRIDPLIAARRKVKPGTTLADVDMGTLKHAGFRDKNHLFNEINRYRRSLGEKDWQTWEQVDFWEVEDAVRRKKRAQGLIPTTPDGLLDEANYKPISHPPISPDKPVTPSRMIYESLAALKNDFDGYTDTVVGRWGETSAPVSSMSEGTEKALGDWVKTLTKNVNTAKSEAALAAEATRDAMLFDYRKKLWNVAAQYVSPFHYYHASASNAWLQNVAADPKWGAIYVDYKEYMAQRHAGLPDFWKQNVAVSGLPGYDKQNPLFFNIEASVNPLYQIIGQDFNDANRRKDWLSNTVDDLSKVIPGIYQPLQWVVAGNLARKGEIEASKRWLGRLIPQTKIIKSVTNAIGIDIPLAKYNEVDPFVALFQDGLDPFEEGRVLRYLAAMPGLTEEQRTEVAATRQGEIWDAAVRGSLSARAPVEAMSYFLGVGYKPRTSADIQTDMFYEDYRRLVSARSIMNPDDYRDAWDAMRTKYKFMDALLIGRKAGDDRDTAFAYNVLSRIPPSEMTDIAKFVHVEPYMLDAFYSNKGDLTKMLPQDRARFMAAITDLSAMLRMPDKTTKQEWSAAKNEYKTMQEKLQADFGDQILDQIYQYYDLEDGDKEDYLKTFPDVELAMQAQTEYITMTPILSAYYGGIDTVARYYNNGMYIQLEKEFGNDIQEKVDWYYYLNDNGQTKEANAFKKAENLKTYFDRKEKLQQQANLATINSARNIPEGKDYAIRPEFEAQSGIQENALSYATTDQQAQAAQFIYGELSDPMRELLQDYYNGGDLPYSVGKRLEYLGADYGLSKQEILRLLGLQVAP